MRSKTGTEPTSSSGTSTGRTANNAMTTPSTPASELIKLSRLCVICVGRDPLLIHARSRRLWKSGVSNASRLATPATSKMRSMARRSTCSPRMRWSSHCIEPLKVVNSVSTPSTPSQPSTGPKSWLAEEA